MTSQKAEKEHIKRCPTCGREILPTSEKTRQRQQSERQKKDELTRLLSDMVNHVYGHHEVQTVLIDRIGRIEKRLMEIEGRTRA